MDGFLILDKPEGITSAECVYKLRSILGTKKIGHCGTLDPLATGLLPISIGEGTKFSNYLTNKDKLYEVGIKFGLETDTGDITGKIVSKSQKSYSLNNLETEVKKTEGYQEQLPPMYSALKVKGKPLYYWARKGVYLSREERKVNVSEVTLIDHNKKEAKLRIACSKGTYIRGLVEDLGRRMKEHYPTNSPNEKDYEILFHEKALKENGDLFYDTVEIRNNNGNNSSFIHQIEIENLRIDLSNNGSTYNTISTTFQIMSGNDTIPPNLFSNVNLNIELANLDVAYMRGYFGNITVSNEVNTNINALKKTS